MVYYLNLVRSPIKKLTDEILVELDTMNNIENINRQ